MKMIDPPSGWKYGFPKPIPDDRINDQLAWLLEEGYPQKEIDNLGEYFFCRTWESDDELIDGDLESKDEEPNERLRKASQNYFDYNIFCDGITGFEEEISIRCFNAGASWQAEKILQFLYSEITERRPYSSSKMCEKVIEFIEQLNTKK